MYDRGVGGPGVSPAATSGDARVGHWRRIRYEPQAVPSYYSDVTVNERVPPGHTGRSPERRQSVQERFQIVPWPWKGAALYVTAGQARATVGTNGEGIGASQGGVLWEGKDQPQDETYDLGVSSLVSSCYSNDRWKDE